MKQHVFPLAGSVCGKRNYFAKSTEKASNDVYIYIYISETKMKSRDGGKKSKEVKKKKKKKKK